MILQIFKIIANQRTASCCSLLWFCNDPLSQVESDKICYCQNTPGQTCFRKQGENWHGVKQYDMYWENVDMTKNMKK